MTVSEVKCELLGWSPLESLRLPVAKQCSITVTHGDQNPAGRSQPSLLCESRQMSRDQEVLSFYKLLA